MGTGKTTLGEYIASKLSLKYIDLDDYIVNQEQRSIPQIFTDIGETGFRNLEFQYLQQCIEQYDIISTGGGIVEGQNSFDLLKSQANVIWLDCDLNVVYERIKNDSNRPNANNKTFFELKSLYSSRVSRYNEIAFTKLNSNQPLPELYQIIQEMVICE
ncbi:shikimate kinase [Staphylococcus gallinarum]|uniref:Shikimate kinase n=1 Tax=Staphylococcus gallinarum TaxID=1293 RepID=A0A3A0W3K9_STAGA|nr:shikimate kinase [Staphylococcus gallinarum]RIP34339.1 shikimate kinase [Staphylococcus gallinarum]